MDIKYYYPHWGSADEEWPVFLNKVKENGYQGIEAGLPLEKHKKEITTLIKEFELGFIGQHWQTKDVDFKKHKENYKRHLYNLVEEEPVLINSHTGLDFFSFSQNVELIKLAHYIEQETGIPIAHETHRSRFSFAAHVCRSFIEELPFIKLTSDFSHWTCVAESMLEDQEEAVNLAIQHTYHIHARVGSSQSPQVISPKAKEYVAELNQFQEWWYAMVKNAADQKRPYMTIVPEYGPIPYALTHPETGKLLASQWEENQFIKDGLSKKVEIF